jgi:hypothetical protein
MQAQDLLVPEQAGVVTSLLVFHGAQQRGVEARSG